VKKRQRKRFSIECSNSVMWEILESLPKVQNNVGWISIQNPNSPFLKIVSEKSFTLQDQYQAY